MKRFFIFSLSALTTASWAGDGIFGTKSSPVPTTTSDSALGAFPIVQMFLALLLVLALVKWGMPMAMKKFGNRWTAKSTPNIQIEETATLGTGTVHVVTVRGKTLLLGSTQDRVSYLADLTAPATAPLPTFQELLEADSGELPQVPDGPGPLNDLSLQLERLKRLGS